MKIGSLKHRITFQRLVTTINENGFEVEVWEGYKTVWASVANLSGREYYETAAIQTEKTVKLVIRHIEDIDTAMRIIFNNKQYNIIYIDNINYESRYVELRAITADIDD